MFFYARRTTAHLDLAAPLDCCCNCGRVSAIDLVETSLRKTRFYLVYGTELELRSGFPYCRDCRRSARRVRPGIRATLLMTALMTSVILLGIAMAESSLPRTMQESPVGWSCALAAVATGAYVSFRARQRSPGGYYQPVRLVEAHIDDGRLRRVHLEFASAVYCRLFARANADRVAAGALEVRAA